MSRGAQKTISRTKDLPFPNEYVRALLGEFSLWAFDEEDCLGFKGKWREQAFQNENCIDLEIGTGNGFHFAHHSSQNPHRNLVGIELKYKPLVQSIRRAVHKGNQNAKIVRYNASLVKNLFGEQELNNVYIHFPDPWSKNSQKKHRLIQPEFLSELYKCQKAESFVEFKTDNKEYFEDALEKFFQSPYEVRRLSRDLHQSEWASTNFVTHFEGIFLRKSLPIYYCYLEKTHSHPV